MKHVSVLEVQSELSNLLDDVARGEEVMILRNGKPIARLVPTEVSATLVPGSSLDLIDQRRDAIAQLREMAKARGTNFSHEEIKSWIEDGRH